MYGALDWDSNQPLDLVGIVACNQCFHDDYLFHGALATCTRGEQQ